ncbi:hypothetical protein CN273_07320 [Bacillus thuringiensis]|uniref:MFS transporter n=1 Tax=Bacillus thuringiensis TaxID=1428 RepID=UPI000BF50C4B|nr:MFS transporter [Bacillus thuringiensis]PFB87256.1 hypothetical protein CN273_07320 [Bacillus thuringiensis]
MRLIFYFGCLFYFIVGVIHVCMGSLIPSLLQYYERTPDQLGILIFFQFTGFLFGVLSSPVLVKKYHYFKTLTFGILAMLVVLGGFLFVKEWAYLAVIAFGLGYGAGLLETTMGSFVISAEQNSAAKFSILEVWFGIGALGFPLLVNYFIKLYAWYFILYGILLFLIFTLLVWYLFGSAKFNNLSPRKNEKEVSLSPLTVSFKNGKVKIILFISLFAFLYAGIETNLANFLSTIMILTNNELISSISISCFWLAIVIGRIFIGKLVHKFNYWIYISSSCFTLVILLFLFPFVRGTGMYLSVIFIIGLVIAGIFPITLILASRIMENNIDEVTSLFIASASLGGALVSFLISWSLSLNTINITFGIFSFFAFILGCIILKMRKISNYSNKDVKKIENMKSL